MGSQQLCQEYETLKLEASDYACFESKCNESNQRKEQYLDLCDEIWGKWLPQSNYISLIEPETFGCVDGYASLERYTPDISSMRPINIEILLPIKEK